VNVVTSAVITYSGALCTKSQRTALVAVRCDVCKRLSRVEVKQIRIESSEENKPGVLFESTWVKAPRGWWSVCAATPAVEFSADPELHLRCGGCL
jgi:hypothetical protein